jgi:hypothetical protein
VELGQIHIIDADFVLGRLHHVDDVGSVADVSDVNAASIYRAEE